MCWNYSREETIQGRKLYEEIRYPDFSPRASNRRERVINQTEIQSEETIGEPTANLDENIRQLENDNKKLMDVSLMVDKLLHKDHGDPEQL